jgi:hypothetical protein
MIQVHQRWKLGNVLFRRVRCKLIRHRRTEDGEHLEDGEWEGESAVYTVTLGAPRPERRKVSTAVSSCCERA